MLLANVIYGFLLLLFFNERSPSEGDICYVVNGHIIVNSGTVLHVSQLK